MLRLLKNNNMNKELILKNGNVATTNHEGALISLNYGFSPTLTLSELEEIVKQVKSNQREGLISGDLIQAVKYEFETLDTLFLTLENVTKLGGTTGVYKEHGIEAEEFKSVTHFIAEKLFISNLAEWEG